MNRTLELIGYSAKKFAKEHGGVACTILACAGAVGSVVLAVKATHEAEKDISRERVKTVTPENPSGELSKVDVVKTVWKHYIPTAICLGGTIGCISGGYILGKRQQAALLSAYAFTKESYKTYQDKVKELYGEEAHRAVKRAIVAEQVDKDHCVWAEGLARNSTLDFGDDSEPTLLFYEEMGGRRFEAKLSQVLQAEYHLNRNYILNYGSVCLNDFYKFLGLPPVEYGDDVGWEIHDDGTYWIDFDHRIERLDDGLEYRVIEPVMRPLSWDEWEKFDNC